jgi:hypothetical protein
MLVCSMDLRMSPAKPISCGEVTWLHSDIQGKQRVAKLLERWSGEEPGSHGAAAAQQHSLGL